MPHALLVAPAFWGGVAGAAGAVGGAALAGRANNRATEANSKAQAEALAFQREEAAREEASRLRAEEMQRQQWEAYQAMRAPYRAAAANILAKYGLGGAPSAPQTMPAGWSPSDVSAGVNARKSYAELAATPSTPALVAPRLTLADLSNWSKTPYRGA